MQHSGATPFASLGPVQRMPHGRTTSSGSVEASYSSLPFGEDLGGDNGSSTYGGGNANQDAYHFAALDHDFESNTDHATFRQYSPTQGRWMSPDPYDGSNPQSLNRYGYAANNPIMYIDRDGTSLGDLWRDKQGNIYLEGANMTFTVLPLVIVDVGNGGCFGGSAFCQQSLATFTGNSSSQVQQQSPGSAPSNQIVPCFLKGVAIGAASAVVVGGVAAGAVALGIVSAPVVTAVLGAAAVVGGVYAGYNAIQQARAGNWSGFAFGVGAFTGGALVGGSGGGRALAETVNGVPSPSWSIGSYWAQGYRSHFPGGSGGKWWNSGMNPGSATGTATSAGAGVATVAKKGC